jgi:hypothetical protein
MATCGSSHCRDAQRTGAVRPPALRDQPRTILPKPAHAPTWRANTDPPCVFAFAAHVSAVNPALTEIGKGKQILKGAVPEHLLIHIILSAAVGTARGCRRSSL